MHQLTDMESFGERMALRRKALGISQSEVARRAGVSRQAVYQWESTGTKPEKETVMLSVSKALCTSLSFLFGETDDPRPAPNWTSGEGPSSELEERVELAYGLLTEAAKVLEWKRAAAEKIFTEDAFGYQDNDNDFTQRARA